LVGQWKDQLGGDFAAPIAECRNFEHLEADGRSGCGGVLRPVGTIMARDLMVTRPELPEAPGELPQRPRGDFLSYRAPRKRHWAPATCGRFWPGRPSRLAASRRRL